MVDLIAWLIFLAAAIILIACLECLDLFILRRWRSSIRLPDPVAYTDVPSFAADSEIILRVHSTKPARVNFSRCGSAGFAPVHNTQVGAAKQNRLMHRWLGFNWQPSLALPPNTLTPGFYRIDIEHNDNPANRWSMILVVSAPAAQTRPIVVVASTNTWNAYNDFGGLSNYRDSATPPPLNLFRSLLMYFNLRPRVGDRHWLVAVPLPERRPNSAIHNDLIDTANRPSHLAREEAALIRFLESEGARYNVISDRHFAFSPPSSQTRLLIFNTHSEYWSEEMIARLAECIRRGVSVAFLSGNNLFRKVQFLRDAISVIDRATPPDQIVPLIGTYYDALGYMTYAPYRVVEPGHWCFAGLGLGEGSEFGAATAKHPAGSGYETDKLRFTAATATSTAVPSAGDFRTLAIGKNPEGPAFMVCRDTGGGSFVFTAGSVAFAPCIDDDPAIQQLVRNLVDRALQAVPSSAGVQNNAAAAGKDR